ncbi:hypothetical protein [Moorella sp. Hama-1]|uniref:hypothetical protein n=1 Tax=Moorella sp. Hama-1 TaxID=2138101 RepID=UPI000D6593FE|nr:hypothetical protein [Moorella sp. Hama-1]MDN5362761.1 hypothetical protein [Moorella sp. (in: firmicutes)]BCV21343.1 hypothetical protein hamaS1_14120 [Moorella sp. Hama-1]
MLPASKQTTLRPSRQEQLHSHGEAGSYPLEKERQLIARVKVGDSRGARELLNQLLGKTLLATRIDLPVIKVRLVPGPTPGPPFPTCR